MTKVDKSSSKSLLEFQTVIIKSRTSITTLKDQEKPNRMRKRQRIMKMREKNNQSTLRHSMGKNNTELNINQQRI